MQIEYHVDPQRDIPIYQQLVDEITSDIRSNRLAYGDRLPTVQEMENQLGVARGTIKRAYDELERQGLIEKIQGRGTFVSFRTVESADRKEKAMQAIDEMFDTLAKLDFTPSEVRIFLDLKLRQREDETPNLKIAAIECNPETLTQMTEALRKLERVELYSFLTGDVLAYPYKVNEEMDLIVTTAEHYPDILQVVDTERKVVPIALRLSKGYMTQLVKLRREQRIGILTNSERFGELIRKSCRSYGDSLVIDEPCRFSQLQDFAAYCADKDMLLVPEDYERYCPREYAAELKKMERQGKLIRCAYRIEEGSLIYLREKLERIRERQKI